MLKIILDTNFLLIPYQFKLDIFKEIDRIADFNYDVSVLDKTVEELKNISEKQTGKNKEAAKFALKLIEAKKIKALKTTGKNTDDAIFDLASRERFIVATQDKALKRRLTGKGISIIIMRKKSKLELLNADYQTFY